MKTILTILLLTAIFEVKCQLIVEKTPPIIERLLNEPRYVHLFQHTDYNYFKGLSNTRNEQQVIIKTPQGLYCGIKGTGRIYKIEKKGKGLMAVRLDKTVYDGYNFGCYYFFYNNNFYSFGGEGFWNMNGDLRYYNLINKEWNAKPLNKIIPYANHVATANAPSQFLDTSKGTFIIRGAKDAPNFLKNKVNNSQYKNQLWKLNIEKGDWQYLGKIIDTTSEYSSLGILPWGLLTSTVLLNFENNSISSIKFNDQLNGVLFPAGKSNYFELTFVIDSTLYVGNYNGFIDSLKFTSTFFIPTTKKIYSIDTKNSDFIVGKDIFIFFSISCLFIFILFLYYYKWRKLVLKEHLKTSFSTSIESVSSTLDEKEMPLVFRSGKVVELMNEQELNFLKFIIENSEDEKFTTIAEINKFLGTLNRSIEIQKRIRGEMINAVNQKISILTKIKKPIIDKIRSEFDKRSFEYYIKPDSIELAKKILRTSIPISK